MYKNRLKISRLLPSSKVAFLGCVLCTLFIQPANAVGLIDKLDLSPFVPLVLETLMNAATSIYKVLIGRVEKFCCWIIFMNYFWNL